jgi:hypothetical protein
MSDNLSGTELGKTLTIQYGYTTWTFNKTLENVPEDIARYAPAGGGNCLAWVVGHLIDSRVGTLRMLGVELPFDPEKYHRFHRGSDPVTADEDLPALAEMCEDFRSTAGPLAEGLAALNDNLVASAAPFSPGNNPQETVGSLLAGLVFHESYHVGQLGILRRSGGLDSVVK